VIRATKQYENLIAPGPAILAGDFNSNVNWDHLHPSDRNHSAMVTMLSKLGLVSAYHAHRGEPYGSETQPTYYFLWNQAKPYHIDYCFLPESWAPKIRSVEVCAYEGWERFSDHRPVVVEVFASAV
jgi:endonuclease/exonuclease/phosphatase family metal-dependent hydrolase